MILRSGYSTGACAAAAAKGAATLLCGGTPPARVIITLPMGEHVEFVIVRCEATRSGALAAVRKDAGDDPDVTHQSMIVSEVKFIAGDQVSYAAGEGVGTVTKPGLMIPPGEPAINPIPRRMIRDAVREVTPRGLRVTVSIPGGRELAERTFNPRLGIVGGLSVLGTTGIVKPFSAPALTASLKCSLDVAAACGVTEPVLVPGNIGERAALRNLVLDAGQVIQVSNHWGFMLDEADKEPRFRQLLVLGHPGKLAKVVDGEWDTHSSNSPSAIAPVMRIGRAALGRDLPESITVEGIFSLLDAPDVRLLGDALAAEVHKAIRARIGANRKFSVMLVNVAGDVLGDFGDLSTWK
jgi:cobalt-precorrin-5B (C1)-methyltransferase